MTKLELLPPPGRWARIRCVSLGGHLPYEFGDDAPVTACVHCGHRLPSFRRQREAHQCCVLRCGPGTCPKQ